MAEKTTHSLYGGEVIIEFYPNPYHKYVLVGTKERLLSATTVTGTIDKSRVLMIWLKKLIRDFLTPFIGSVLTSGLLEDALDQDNKRKQEAADIGTAVHEWAEAHIAAIVAKTTPPAIPEPTEGMDEDAIKQVEGIRNGVLAFLKWEEQHNVEYVISEQVVYSRKHNYVGTVDCMAKVDGKLSVIDFKTSKGVYPEFYLQAACYRAALVEEFAYEIDQTLLLNFNKITGEFFAHETNEHEEDYAAFLGLLVAKRRLKILDKWDD